MGVPVHKSEAIELKTVKTLEKRTLSEYSDKRCPSLKFRKKIFILIFRPDKLENPIK
jgi:hypothetical protein